MNSGRAVGTPSTRGLTSRLAPPAQLVTFQPAIEHGASSLITFEQQKKEATVRLQKLNKQQYELLKDESNELLRDLTFGMLPKDIVADLMAKFNALLEAGVTPPGW